MSNWAKHAVFVAVCERYVRWIPLGPQTISAIGKQLNALGCWGLDAVLSLGLVPSGLEACHVHVSKVGCVNCPRLTAKAKLRPSCKNAGAFACHLRLFPHAKGH